MRCTPPPLVLCAILMQQIYGGLAVWYPGYSGSSHHPTHIATPSDQSEGLLHIPRSFWDLRVTGGPDRRARPGHRMILEADDDEMIDAEMASVSVLPVVDQAWVLEHRIGKGSQGHVWRASPRRVCQPAVAIKLLRNCADARMELAAFSRLLRYPPHPNLIQMRFGLMDRCTQPVPVPEPESR